MNGTNAKLAPINAKTAALPTVSAQLVLTLLIETSLKTANVSLVSSTLVQSTALFAPKLV